MKVFVTAKGAAMKENDWVEGQEISCSDPVGNLFIEKGIATAEKVEAIKSKADEPQISKEKKETKKSK
jgi:hypothetical protein